MKILSSLDLKSVKRVGTSLAVATVLAIAAGCTPQANHENLTGKESAGLIPSAGITVKSDGSISLVDQLRRYRGQTQFLTPSPYSRMGLEGAPRATAASADAKGGGGRAEQESDIYKVGKAGSKLLFLLNNYRGLQVISFAAGADKPELVSRVKATGNYPDDMYYDEANDRLLVLERLYHSEDGSYNYSDMQSRIVVYDVSTPSAPVISTEIPVSGNIADSRIVGNVLYIASSVRPENGSDSKAEGIVTSFDFSGKTIKEIEKLKLSLPAVYGENMNIQTVENADGSYSYYLVAVLSETGWGWGDRKSLVEVVDISDAKGKIKSLMSVSAKGFIRERSQTLIKKNTLIVTSNYTTEMKTAAGGQIARIAVETFGLPKAGLKALTEKEAQYRQLHMELALEGKTGAELDKAREVLVADPALGLKGKFVLTAAGQLRKLVADSVVTVGDTTGLSSSLQDVRYQDGLLYAFWVPANEVDPLDVFDISDPEAGVKHLNRLQFEGWVSKAIPMTHDGRNYIVALGWIVPAVNNERNMRHPQAAIFEIKKVGAKYRADQISQLTFANSNTWTDFNSPDRFIEVRADGNGQGQVLFAASQYSQKSYQSGGKILQFDLAKLTSEDPNTALSEGAFLSGKSGWLRRVFTNTEIDRINTYSDQALAIYDTTKLAVDKTTKATAVLELARQIRDYKSVAVAGVNFGIQFISDYSWYSEDESQTTLRLVDAKSADAEKGKTTELKVAGSYIASQVSNGVVYVLTNSYKSEVNAKGEWTSSSKSYLHALTPGTVGFNLVNTTEWDTSRQNSATPPMGMRIRLGMPSGYSSGNFVTLGDGTLLAQIDNSVKVVSTAGAKDVVMKNCGAKDRTEVQASVVNGSLYVTSADSVEITEVEGTTAMRNYIAKATYAGGTLTCGAELNIPGTLLTVTAEGSALVDDSAMIDIVTKKGERWVADGKTKIVEYKVLKTENTLVGLELAAGKATLVDAMPKTSDGSYGSSTLKSTRPGELVQISNFESSGGSFRPFRGGGFRGGSMPRMRDEQVDSAFEFVQVDAKGFLTTQKFGVTLATGSNARLIGIEKDPKNAEKFVGLVQTGRRLQVVEWSEANKRPEVRKLVPLNEQMKRMTAVESVVTSNSYYGNTYHFTPEQMSFEVVEGLSGINQFFVK